jgi:hypothetical protein
MKNWKYTAACIVLIFGVITWVPIGDARDNPVKERGSHNRAPMMSQVYTQNDEEQKGQSDEGQMGKGDEGQQGEEADQGQTGQSDEGQQGQADEGQEGE